jgi:hypothetical protein
MVWGLKPGFFGFKIWFGLVLRVKPNQTAPFRTLETLINKHVLNGCLSDLEHLQLYYLKGKDTNGLQLYRCIRGTSDVESFHQLLEMRFQPWNAGPRYSNNVTALLRHRFNIW